MGNRLVFNHFACRKCNHIGEPLTTDSGCKIAFDLPSDKSRQQWLSEYVNMVSFQRMCSECDEFDGISVVPEIELGGILALSNSDNAVIWPEILMARNHIYRRVGMTLFHRDRGHFTAILKIGLGDMVCSFDNLVNSAQFLTAT